MINTAIKTTVKKPARTAVKKLSTLILAFTSLSLAIQNVHAEDFEIAKATASSNVKIAIVPFAGSDVSKIIANDLTTLGEFSLNTNLPEQPHSSGEIMPLVWQQKGIPYVVVGNSVKSGNNAVINYELIDINNNARILTERPSKVTARNDINSLRMAGHKIADHIYELLTGIKGDFSGKLAFIVESGTGKNKTATLMVSDVDGENATAIYQTKGAIKSLAATGNGRQVVFTAGQNDLYPLVYTADVYGKNVNLVTPEKANHIGGSLSPDGSQLLYSSDIGGNFDIYLAGSNGGGSRRVVASPAADISPSWAPDGNSFIYTSDPGGNNRPRLYSYNLRSGTSQALPYGGGGYASDGRYSMDGKKIAYTTLSGGVIAEVGGGSRTVSSLAEAPNVSPNGQHIVSSRGNAITIMSGGNAVSIDPTAKSPVKGKILKPVWLKPQS